MHRSRFAHRLTVAAGASLVLVNRLSMAAGLRRRRDGWRRAAGLVLRDASATFVLSAFGLDGWSDVGAPKSADVEAARAHVSRRLREFFFAEPTSHVRIHRDADQDTPVPADGPSYTLAFAPPVTGAERFVRPDEWIGEDQAPARNGAPLLNIVCRIDADGVTDVWLRINHVGIDGVPAQEMLTRLETAWGGSGTGLYPAAASSAACPPPRATEGRPGLGEAQRFLDFAPLLRWRKKENERLPEPMTVAAALLWCLGRHPAFAGRWMGSTVEVPAIDGLGRGVGLVVIRPADYCGRSGGMARYAASFNRQVELIRSRVSPGCLTLDAMSHLSPAMATVLLRHALDHQPRAFGTLVLTILKDARVFGAPVADTGHPDGFMAIGDMALPAEDGGAVGCMTAKGPLKRVATYAEIVREAIRCCADAP